MDYIAKANIGLNTFAPGGTLLAEQAESFVDIMIDESKLLGLVTTKMMERPQFQQPRVGFTDQVLFPDEEMTETPEADRASPTTDKRELSTVRFKALARISYDTLEEVLTQERLPDELLPLLAKAAWRDVEKVIISGNTSLPATTKENRLLRKLDGVIAQASNIYDAGGQDLNANVLDEMDIAMPSRFANDRMAIFTARKAALRYRKSKAARPTPAGDEQLIKAAIDDHHGSPIVDIPLWPDNLGAQSNQTTALRTDPKNIWVGFQKKMDVRTKDEPDAGYVLFVMRFRFDVLLFEPNATILATAVKARS